MSAPVPWLLVFLYLPSTWYSNAWMEGAMSWGLCIHYHTKLTLAHGKKCGGKERKKEEKSENTRVGETGDSQQREIRRISSTTVSCVSGHTPLRASGTDEVE